MSIQFLISRFLDKSRVGAVDLLQLRARARACESDQQNYKISK